MDETGKVKRVVETGPGHRVLLVLDATTGQNGLIRRACSARSSTSPASS